MTKILIEEDVVKLALEALELFERAGLATLKTIEAITSLRQAILESSDEALREQAQPEIKQSASVEPVAWVKRATEWLLDLPNTPTDAPYFTNGVFKGDCQELAALLQTSTAPPYVPTERQRQPWVGLTDEEQQELYDAWIQLNDGWGSFYALIEVKLKEKNT